MALQSDLRCERRIFEPIHSVKHGAEGAPLNFRIDAEEEVAIFRPVEVGKRRAFLNSITVASTRNTSIGVAINGGVERTRQRFLLGNLNKTSNAVMPGSQ